VYGVKYNSSISKNEIYSINLDTGATVLKQQFAFPSGYWTPGSSFMDSYNGKYYLKDSENLFLVYDTIADTMSQTAEVSSGFQAIYQTPWAGKNLISKKTTSEGTEEVHIGENSLVTYESSGRQQLYATNAATNQIDLNIKKGTNLLIDGVNVIDAIHGSVAMGAAMASLPTSAGDAQYTCGLGTGFHNSSAAISGGCGFDFKNFDFVETMPKAFHDASFNFGVASVVEGEQDGATLKAGITFKFGAPKKIKTAEAIQFRTENKIDAVMQENKILKDQIAAINLKLETLNMVASN
jgi:hypothetical protein